mmetsp:Transcript_13297/g.18236  ORF Transcript_13297/g.18236 Transcript_13297/m.18236 type:complete len:1116 (+) Transcript_13297:112-3459(+)|eukprot:CAMPEP_0170088774 /NCGR_PEP_ID=MMETSP0019_2-20121128/22993_1 /TAXON_ID=98059 /ORGANISM="Dinobryon sp., Strain UTEXLB2267" /LENGTH=1115 /DNA_ID=CAMNT_0010307243 /DNA_START=34 /DNA_END=3381 /DNA_ORIENTATION=-
MSTSSRSKLPQSKSNENDEDCQSIESKSPSVRSQSSNRRREIELNREKKKKDEEANLTFAPKSIAKKVFVSKDVEEDRFMTLYSDAKKRHQEQKEEKLKQKISQDLTFTPKITSRASSRASSREKGQSVGERLYSTSSHNSSKLVGRVSSDDTEGTGVKSTQSAKSANSRSSSRSSINSDLTISSVGSRSISSSRLSKSSTQSACSFTPSISKRAKSIDRSSVSDRGVGDRLYMHGKVIKEKLEKVKAEREQKASESCTFAPRTNFTPNKSRASSANGKPSTSVDNNNDNSTNRLLVTKEFPDRMKKYEEYKTKRLEDALQAKAQHEVAVTTFKPQLVAKRTVLPTSNSAIAAHLQLPVHERLSISIEKDRSEIEAVVYAENTFKPQLVAKRVASPNAAASEYSSATERLFKEGEKKKKEAELERQQAREDMLKECCFVPKIGFGSRIKEKEGDEPTVPVFDRLASLNSRVFMDEILSKIKSEIELKDCTFQPRIPQASTSIHSHSSNHNSNGDNNSEESVYVRLNKEADLIRAEKIRREAERIADELASATFSPALPVSSLEIVRRRSSVASVSGVPEEDLFTRLSKPLHSPKASHGDLDCCSVNSMDCESLSSSFSRRSNSSHSIILPEQEVDRIVQRLYSSHTKSSEKLLGLNTAENSEQIYERKVNALPERALEKVFRRLSLTSPNSQDANCTNGNNNNFIDNPMTSSGLKRSSSQRDMSLSPTPTSSSSSLTSSQNNSNNTSNNANSPVRQRLHPAVILQEPRLLSPRSKSQYDTLSPTSESKASSSTPSSSSNQFHGNHLSLQTSSLHMESRDTDIMAGLTPKIKCGLLPQQLAAIAAESRDDDESAPVATSFAALAAPANHTMTPITQTVTQQAARPIRSSPLPGESLANRSSSAARKRQETPDGHRESKRSSSESNATNGKPSGQSRTPNPLTSPPAAADGSQLRAKPSEEFLSKIKRFSSPSNNASTNISSITNVTNNATPFSNSAVPSSHPEEAVGIVEKINAATKVNKTLQASTTPIATAATPNSTTTGSIRSKTPHIPLTQTVASVHNQHQRAITLASSAQTSDNTWDSNPGKVLRGKKKVVEPAAADDLVENSAANIVNVMV